MNTLENRLCVTVLNKTNLVTPDEVGRLETLLLKPNPKARIVRAVQSRIDPALILGTGLFDLLVAEQAPGWMDAPEPVASPS